MIKGKKNGHAYIIAEAEINHNGKLEIALDMVRVAKNVGADAIKFQYIVADNIVEPVSPYYDLFKRVELDYIEFQTIFECAVEIGIDCFLTVPDIESLRPVLELSPPYLKIGSSNLTNVPLLEEVGKAGLPVILSTGLGTLGEVETAVEALNLRDEALTLLHCTVQYPAPLKSLNLRAIATMLSVFPQFSIGFSDHSEGELAGIAAFVLGANVFEKHFTLDRSQEGPDHGFSTDPDGFDKYVKAIRQTEMALGDGIKRPDDEEVQIINRVRRFIVAARKISRGKIFEKEDLSCLRIDSEKEGIEPRMLAKILGWNSPQDYMQGEPLIWDDFKGE